MKMVFSLIIMIDIFSIDGVSYLIDKISSKIVLMEIFGVLSFDNSQTQRLFDETMQRKNLSKVEN